MTSTSEVAAVVDPIFDRALADDYAPGIVYGVVQGGRLVYARGIGRASLVPGDETPPDQDTVFSIASMTKSFTAATVLSLRDAGRLTLDDSVARYVPELGTDGWASMLTIRHLLTMGGGFPTDDPWGDRQQGLPLDQFRRLLAAELNPRWTPGVRFEYSNLGYAVIGLVIEAVTNLSYPEAVHRHVLDPVGMTDSAFDLKALRGRRVATGYVKRPDGRLDVEPIAARGAFAPMGGLVSTVGDLARWVSQFLAANQSSADTNLPTSLLREMQVGQRFVEAVSSPRAESYQPELVVRHYGFGLYEERLPWGRSMSHSGGYPGYGSHMRWHPESGWGVVALANRTYARMSTVATSALAALVRSSPRMSVPSPLEDGLVSACQVVTSLLNKWDDAVLTEHFADNVALDMPWEIRRAEALHIHQELGALRLDAHAPVTSEGPGHRVFWLMGEREGRVRCEVLLGPQSADPIQWVSWTLVPEPEPALIRNAVRALRDYDDQALLGPAQRHEGGRTDFLASSPHGELEVKVERGEGVTVRPRPARVRTWDD